MKTIILLAMHGAPPGDYPRPALAEFFSLHARLELAGEAEKPALLARFAPLERQMRGWPRTAQNDPFYAFSGELARELEAVSGHQVLVGFNEFCAPDIPQALAKAVELGAGRIVVVTPMMTRGGEHAEIEIPALIHEFGSMHPEIDIKYAWPFEKGEIAAFLVQHLQPFL